MIRYSDILSKVLQLVNNSITGATTPLNNLTNCDPCKKKKNKEKNFFGGFYDA